MTEEKVVIVPERPYANHGSTVASWVMIAIMTTGVLVGAVAYDLAQPVIVFVGAGIIGAGSSGWIASQECWLRSRWF